ncbi:hypothetical protein SAMN04488136_12932 [Vibrio xiamenensis]|uniref:Uncharacterized protein n=1 Tax=Vibrio xiamenensis TaxID=861298 RepID=A0A1G8F962_9VIBR|nr:hypothetical protein SAMN04488136_12932 [Vibrio xiamenensis]
MKYYFFHSVIFFVVVLVAVQHSICRYNVTYLYEVVCRYEVA